MARHTRDSLTVDLFGDYAAPDVWQESLDVGVSIFHRYAQPTESALLEAVQSVITLAPFRHMQTPGGFHMSVAMTNCGLYGWISDKKGYRYSALDPMTKQPWPCLPPIFLKLANETANQAGFPDFIPDACLINRYEPGARLSLHQDNNERDLTQPIVSVSLGLPAVFLFGGIHRNDKTRRITLQHGDVIVWGSSARLRYHGVLPLKTGNHDLLGAQRINLTFRKAA